MKTKTFIERNRDKYDKDVTGSYFNNEFLKSQISWENEEIFDIFRASIIERRTTVNTELKLYTGNLCTNLSP